MARWDDLAGGGCPWGTCRPKGHRYPVEVISHYVWLYFRFPLSFREVEGLMLQRGVIVSYQTVRRWCAKFGQAYADGLRHRRPRPGDKWHPVEVIIKVNGERKYPWRAVDQDGNVLDILVQSRRDKAAARRFLRRLMTKTRAVPRVIVTDKLRSYGSAHREVEPSAEHRSRKGLNNRAENSHQPTRQRERATEDFHSTGGAQRFLSAFSGNSPHLRPRRHLMTAPEHRAETTIRFAIWDQITAAVDHSTTARTQARTPVHHAPTPRQICTHPTT
ncbi:IS6 family transposase [Streptomyces sp. NPDC005122]